MGGEAIASAGYHAEAKQGDDRQAIDGESVMPDRPERDGESEVFTFDEAGVSTKNADRSAAH